MIIKFTQEAQKNKMCHADNNFHTVEQEMYDYYILESGLLVQKKDIAEKSLQDVLVQFILDYEAEDKKHIKSFTRSWMKRNKVE